MQVALEVKQKLFGVIDQVSEVNGLKILGFEREELCGTEGDRTGLASESESYETLEVDLLPGNDIVAGLVRLEYRIEGDGELPRTDEGVRLVKFFVDPGRIGNEMLRSERGEMVQHSLR